MKLGTSSLVVAAFIGPGTVLTCASAGLKFGYELVWVLLFATLAVFVLQSFTGATGILAGKGLGEAIKDAANTPLKKGLMFGLVILGLGIGCAAFESGNLAGATAGVKTLMGVEGNPIWMVLVVTVLAFVLLLQDVSAIIKVLSWLVALMSILFIAAAIIAPINWPAALSGLFVPSIPAEGLITIMALIGTTIVTYNLFLHPSAAKTYWKDTPAHDAWRGELTGMALFIPLGGFISIAILLAGATLASENRSITNIAEFAPILEPVAGSTARYFFGMGLLAAGLTSAVTAPLAAAAGISELFGWEKNNRNAKYLGVWLGVLVAGFFFNTTGISPLSIIIAAQAANGLLLPLIAVFVLYLTYQQKAVSLPQWYMLLGGIITIVCAGLGIKTLSWVWGQLAM